jgi:hypothetical protein
MGTALNDFVQLELSRDQMAEFSLKDLLNIEKVQQSCLFFCPVVKINMI